MKKPLGLFLLSFVVITVLIGINRWDIPVTVWLCTVFTLVALGSGSWCFVNWIG